MPTYVDDFVPVSVYERGADNLPTGNVARFVIPRSSYQARLARDIHERAGMNSVVSRAMHAVSATNPLPEGDTLIWQNDERDARSERPLGLFRQGTEEQMPLLVLGGGVHHWRDLQDQANEAQHYGGDDLPYWDKVAPESALRHDYAAWVEKAFARRNGRRVFSFHRRAMLAEKRDFWN